MREHHGKNGATYLFIWLFSCFDTGCLQCNTSCSQASVSWVQELSHLPSHPITWHICIEILIDNNFQKRSLKIAIISSRNIFGDYYLQANFLQVLIYCEYARNALTLKSQDYNTVYTEFLTFKTLFFHLFKSPDN